MYPRQILARAALARRSEMTETKGNGFFSKDVLIEKSKVPAVMIGNYELRFEPEEIDDYYAEKARNEIRETPEVVEEALKKIRELLKEEPDLIVPDDDDYFRKFLRPVKWYPESALALMKKFYQFRVNYTRVCKDLVPSNEKKVLSSIVITPLPLRNADGCRILMIESGKVWKPKEISLEEIFRAVMLSLDGAMAEPKTQVSGVRVILDMEGLPLSHVTYFTPSFASMVLEWVQRCLPSRLKGVHIVNQPYVFNMVFAIFKPFINEKLRKRILFHGTDRASVLKFIDSKALPTRLGGELDIPHEAVGESLWEYFSAFEDDFEASNRCGYLKKLSQK